MIEVLNADIATLPVDAIVNAANSSLLGGGGVDGAIHRAAGQELTQYCKNMGGCPTGEARITPGFRLPAKWIIHTVGPVWRGGSQGESILLERCYTKSFQLALRYDVGSIAFPAISTGVYGFPKEQAAAIAVSVMRRYEGDFAAIVACCYSQRDAAIYQSLLGADGD